MTVIRHPHGMNQPRSILAKSMRFGFAPTRRLTTRVFAPRCGWLPTHTRVLNRLIHNWNEKPAALRGPELTPVTMVTNHVCEITVLAERQRIIMEPIGRHGGKGMLIELIERSFFSHNYPDSATRQTWTT